MEEWKDIEGYEGLYQVSNYGRIKSLKRHHVRNDRILTFGTDKDGYKRVDLRKDGFCKTKRVHILVAKAFVPNPNGYTIVHHKDHNVENNRAENLEWMTKNEHDEMHRIEMGTRIYLYTLDNQFVKSFDSITEASKTIGCGLSNIIRCCNGGFFDKTRNKWHNYKKLKGYKCSFEPL